MNTTKARTINVRVLEEGTKVTDSITGVSGYVTAWGHYYGHDADMVRMAYRNGNGTLIEDWLPVGRLIVKKEGEDE